MSTMTLPTGWAKYDQGTGWVKFARPAHSSSMIDLVTFKRTEGRTPEGIATSKYQVRFAAGIDAANLALDFLSLPNTLVTFECRNVEHQNNGADTADSGGMTTIFSELGALISSATFLADVTDTLALPLDG